VTSRREMMILADKINDGMRTIDAIVEFERFKSLARVPDHLPALPLVAI
jgi:hypothetical protein